MVSSFKQALDRGQVFNEPPFRVRYYPVIVFVDLGKEIVKLCTRDGDAGLCKRAS